MKNSSINKILDNFVINKLSIELKKNNFKLKKTDSKLILNENGISLIIQIYRRDYRFIWDEITGDAFICFNIFTRLEFSNYNKWYFEEFQEKVNTEKFINKENLYPGDYVIDIAKNILIESPTIDLADFKPYSCITSSSLAHGS